VPDGSVYWIHIFDMPGVTFWTQAPGGGESYFIKKNRERSPINLKGGVKLKTDSNKLI
jgi:hypothetical protein